MEKKERQERLLEAVQEVLNELELDCDPVQLQEDGLYAMLYLRYQNALSLLREEQSGYLRLKRSLQFLVSANQAYFGTVGHREDPLRDRLAQADRWIDWYLQDKREE